MHIVQQPLYIYIDESGDFNFSPKGTNFYTITALTTYKPHERLSNFDELRQCILSGKMCAGLDETYLQKKLSRMFHAAEDKQPVRNLVFEEIQQMKYCRAYSIVIQKNKMYPSLRHPNKFYPRFMSSVLSYIFKTYSCSDICISISGTPVSSHRVLFKKAVVEEITNRGITIPYSIEYNPAEQHHMLQVVDYINWAIYRKWEREDNRSYNLIKHQLGRPELDVFRYGTTSYY